MTLNFSTIEESRKYLAKKHKDWMDNLTPEKKEEYKKKYSYKNWLERQTDEVKEKYKLKCKGHCDVCGKDYCNIYIHNKSQKHILLSNKSKTMKEKLKKYLQ